jgi:hypothetical protein
MLSKFLTSNPIAGMYKAKTILIVSGVALVATIAAVFFLRLMWIGEGKADGVAKATAAQTKYEGLVSQHNTSVEQCNVDKAKLHEIIKSQKSSLSALADESLKAQKRAQAAIRDSEKKFEKQLNEALVLAQMQTNAAFEEQCRSVDELLKNRD